MNTLTWNGYIKEPEYEVKGFKLADEPLSPLAEEMLYKLSAFYTEEKEKNMRQAYLYDKHAMKDAYSDLKYELTTNQKKVPFMNDEYWNLLKEMHNHIEAEKIAKKEYEKIHDEEIKAEKKAIKDTYGFALVDGEKVAINPNIERSGWFVGRGKNSVNMHWKYRVEDKDIKVNWISEEKCPFCETTTSDTEVDQCASYKVRIGHNNEMSVYKSIRFSKNSSIGQEEEQHKFETCKQMIKDWAKIEAHILKGIKSNDPKIKQAALCLYLVQKTGIRIGGDSGARDNGVEGASTLKVSSIKIEY